MYVFTDNVADSHEAGASSSGGGSEYDRMLAMQLANDLNSTQDLHRLVEAFEKPRSLDMDQPRVADVYDVNSLSDGTFAHVFTTFILYLQRIPSVRLRKCISPFIIIILI